MMHRKLTFTTLALVMIAALLLSAAPPVVQAEPDAPDATYSYTNNVAYNIPDGTSTTQYRLRLLAGDALLPGERQLHGQRPERRVQPVARQPRPDPDEADRAGRDHQDR